MFVHYNPNPTGRNVEDCAIRAVAKALDTDWETAFALVSANAYSMGDMAHSNSVWGATLRQHGWYRSAIPNGCPNCYTVEDFAREHPVGKFVLSCSRHVLTVESGDIFDSWDSSTEIPQYFWFKKEE